MKKPKTNLMKWILSVVVLASSLNMYAQNITVKGNVIDNNEEPLIGVTIQVQGTSIGTITDIDGNFELSGVPSNGVLDISYVGMQGQTLQVDGRTFISVVLSEDTETLDELVVIGYGTVRKRDLTGAVSSVRDRKSVV